MDDGSTTESGPRSGDYIVDYVGHLVGGLCAARRIGTFGADAAGRAGSSAAASLVAAVGYSSGEFYTVGVEGKAGGC